MMARSLLHDRPGMRTDLAALLCASAALGAAACGGPGLDPASDWAAAEAEAELAPAIVAGVPVAGWQERAILDFANGATLLELRAVPGYDGEGILAQRVVEGRPFDSIDALEGVRGVGPKHVLYLLAYLTNQGGDPVCVASLDGQCVNVREQELLLVMFNCASEPFLDVTVGLDKRTVPAIIARRPLADLAVAGSAPWFGADDALKSLAYAPHWRGLDGEAIGEQQGGACAATAVPQAGPPL